MARQRSRRAVLEGMGALVTAGVAGLAGCAGTENGDGGEATTETATTATAAETTATETASAASDTRTVTDMASREVEVPTTVERVIGIGTGGLRLLSYLDATDMVVGVENFETSNEDRPFRPYVVANPDLADRTPIGSRKSPDAERMLAQEPDVVVWGYAKQKKADDLQSKLGVPVVSIQQGDLNPALRPTFYDALELVGEVVGASDRAASLIQYTKDAVADMESREPDAAGPSAYVGYMGRGKHGFTRTQPAYPPFAMVGANNVVQGIADDQLKGRKGASETTLDPEQLIEWDPEYVFVDLGTESYDALGDEEYQSITAIQEGNVHALFPNRDYSANFGTVLANSYYVGSVLFPDAYADVDPVAKADEIYEEFLGEPIYDQLTEVYGRELGPMEI
jgi:iron complex transport system substrate-binding protein